MYEVGAVEKVGQSLKGKEFASVYEFLDSLRKVARRYYIPVMRKKTTELLKSLIIKNKPKEMLEIGTSLGVSGMTALASSAGRLTTIDIDEEVTNQAKDFFARHNLLSRCEFILGDAVSVVSMMDNNRYDFIILDGPKGQYIELYKMLAPMLNKDGIMFVDDINYARFIDKKGLDKRKHRTIINNMKEFLDTINNDINIKATVYDIEDGVLLAEKI